MAIVNEGGTAAIAEEVTEEKSSSGFFGNLKNYVSALGSATSDFVTASTQPITDWFNGVRSDRQTKKLEKEQAKSENKIADYDEQIAKLEAERDKEQSNLDMINDSLDMYAEGATVSEVKAMNEDAKDKTYVLSMKETNEDGKTSSHNEAYTSAQIEQMRVEIAQYDAAQNGTDPQANLDAMHEYEADVKDAVAEEQSNTGLVGKIKDAFNKVDGGTLDTDKVHDMSEGTVIGGVTGVAAGVATGAAIGSVVPGAGTVIGASYGATMGIMGGMVGSDLDTSSAVETDAAGNTTAVAEGSGHIRSGMNVVSVKNSLNVSADGVYHDEDGNEISVSRSEEEIEKMRQIVASADALDAGGSLDVANGVMSGLQSGGYTAYGANVAVAYEDDAMYANAGIDDELASATESSGRAGRSLSGGVSGKEERQGQRQSKREARAAAAENKFGDLEEADAGDDYEDDDSVSII